MRPNPTVPTDVDRLPTDPDSPILDEVFGSLTTLIRDRPVTVLSGAGCSTESGIPDYRGPGSARRAAPMQYRDFMTSAANRRRYWARSAAGWSRVATATPNPAHQALAALERVGVVMGVVTQNVDGLHQRAGSRRVVELHGSLARVRCTECRHVESRASLQHRLCALNPDINVADGVIAPDGDAVVSSSRSLDLRIPGCTVCDGVVKPDVVFFGENVPKERLTLAWDLYRDGEILLVIGSSLTVFSGYRFVLRAAKERRPVAIISIGETRGDAHAAVKLDARVGMVLPLLVEHLGGRL